MMSYFGAAILILFLLGVTSLGWYWLFKRFERRMSERFDDIGDRVNENFRTLEVIIDRVYELPVKLDACNESICNLKLDVERLSLKAGEMVEKLDIVQGLALVIKQELVIRDALKILNVYREEGRIDQNELERLNRLIKEMRFENLSRY